MDAQPESEDESCPLKILLAPRRKEEKTVWDIANDRAANDMNKRKKSQVDIARISKSKFLHKMEHHSQMSHYNHLKIGK